MDEFFEPFLRFRIAKPAGWTFVPAAWSPVVQLRNAADGVVEWLKHAGDPFVCFMRMHDSPDHAYPTVQVTSRPSVVPSSEAAAELLERQLRFLENTYEDFEVLDATADAIVGGHRANRVVSRFRLQTEKEKYLDVLSRSVVIFTPGAAFTMGLSSSTDPRYFDENEFSDVVRSVTIG